MVGLSLPRHSRVERADCASSVKTRLSSAPSRLSAPISARRAADRAAAPSRCSVALRRPVAGLDQRYRSRRRLRAWRPLPLRRAHRRPISASPRASPRASWRRGHRRARSGDQRVAHDVLVVEAHDRRCLRCRRACAAPRRGRISCRAAGRSGVGSPVTIISSSRRGGSGTSSSASTWCSAPRRG